jgi:nitroimidazol reductase NimA-like FMN-containing flavoprotein (pyridoxamine 5'-phosphate oxidase superfamily)
MQESIELTYAECRHLLSAGGGGRMAVSSPEGPHIVPVNYSLVDEAIVVQTSTQSVLGRYGPDSVLAFEVDQFDHERQCGWSVVARGPAEIVVDDAALEHIRVTWEPRPWASSAVGGLHLRLRWTDLTGRRIGTGWDLEATLPVRRNV